MKPPVLRKGVKKKKLVKSCSVKTHLMNLKFCTEALRLSIHIYFPYIEGRLSIYLKKFDIWHENGLSLKQTWLFLHPLISINMIVTRQYVFRVTCSDWSMKNGWRYCIYVRNETCYVIFLDSLYHLSKTCLIIWYS